MNSNTTVTTNTKSEVSSQKPEEESKEIAVQNQEDGFFEHLNYLSGLNRETMHMQDTEMQEGEEGYQVQFLDPTTKQPVSADRSPTEPKPE